MTDLYSVAIGNDRFVRVGSSGLIQWSEDAINWFLEPSGTIEDLYGVAFGNGVFVAVGSNGVVLTSASKNVWVNRVSGTSENIHGIAFADIFMAVGSAGLMMTSPTGIAWQIILAQTTSTLRAVSMGAGLFLAVGDNDAKVEGQFVSSFPQVTLEPVFGAADVSTQTGSFNHLSTDDIAVIEDVHRDAEVPPVYEFLTSRLSASAADLADTATLNKSANDTYTFILRLFDPNISVVEEFAFLPTALQGLVLPALIDTLAQNDSPVFDAVLNAVLAEDIDIVEIAGDQLILAATLADSYEFDDSLQQTASFSEVIIDALIVVGALIIDGDQYQAWVINTKNEAISSYANYAFNSFCEFGGKYYGANSTGLYELIGTKDDGETISAVVRTGLLNFGTSFQTRIPRAYLGIMNSGAVVLKTITNENVERWYELTETNSGLSKARIKLTKGVRSSYWQFELVSKDFFRLESIDLMPIVLSRRPQSVLNT